MGFEWGDLAKLSPAYYIYDQYKHAGDPYKNAAAGARDISQQGQAFSSEQWRRQMEGLDRAQGAYAPSQSYWQSAYGSQGPGAMENWWNQNQSQFTRQPLQQQAYNGYQDWMNNGVNATQQGANAANQYLGGPTAASQAYGAMGQGLQSYSGPTSGQEAYRFNQGSFQQPGAGESWYANNQNRYNTSGAANDVYQQFGQQLYGPSRSEGFTPQTADPQRAERDWLQAMEWSKGQTAGQRNEGENKGYIRDAGDISQYYQSQMGQLAGPGEFEQFMSADINGNNPMYERTKQRGIAQVNQEMARRGHFNSDAAIDRIGNYTAELDAQDYDRRRQSAQAAQQMQLARIGQGTSSAAASSANKIAQGQGLQGIDVQNEAGELNRKQFGQDATNAYMSNMRADQELAMRAAGQSDQAKLARLQGLQGMGTAADQGNLSYLNAGQNAASDAQAQQLARLMGQQNAANSVDQTRLASDQQGLARMLASFNMAQGSDQSGLARAQQLFAQGQGLDANMMARFGQQGQMAQGIDQQTLAQLLGAGGMAGQAQGAEQQRLQQAFASLFGLNNAQAGQVGQFYGQGAAASGTAFADAMNALANSYGLQAQGQGAGREFLMQLMGLGIKGAGVAAGAG